MKIKVITLASALCGVACVGGVSVAAEKAAKPNVVFILADDLGYGDVGFMGQKKIKTPRLDALSKQSLVYTHMHAGAAVCGPSRAALLTGMSQDIGLVKGNPGGNPARENFPKEEILISECFKDAGYKTAYLGKWGMGAKGSTGYPLNQGFDYFVGYDTHKSAHNYYPTSLCKNDGQLALPKNKNKKAPRSEKTYTHDLFTKEAVDYINQDHAKPFFLFVGYCIPHSPYDPPELLGYENEKGWDKTAKAYAAMITRMDRDVGAISDALEAKGLTENTIFVFTSDNGTSPYGKGAPGFFNSSGELRGVKRDVFEGGHRVPFIVRWPGKVKAGVSKNVSSFHDLMPTLCELSGVTGSAKSNGISQVPTWTGQGEQKQHDFLYWEHIQMQSGGMGRQCVLDVKNNIKGLRFGKNDPVRVYDLNADPQEKTNLAKEKPELAKALKDKLDTMRSKSKWWPIEMYNKGYKPPKE